MPRATRSPVSPSYWGGMGDTPPQAETAHSSCKRSLGRAQVAVPCTLEIPRGRFRSTIIDLSLEGARIETDERIEKGEYLALMIDKLSIFGTVQWAKDGAIGIRFDEKLPKPYVLKLLGQPVDLEACREAEAMLAAKDWVMGAQVARPRTLTLADVIGARYAKTTGSSYLQSGLNWLLLNRIEDETTRGRQKRKVISLFAWSAIFGSAIGLVSALVF